MTKSKRKIRLNTNRIRLDYVPHPLWCVRQTELADYLGCHPSSIWRSVSNGSFLKPVTILGGTKLWRVETLKRYFEKIEKEQQAE